MNIPGFAAEASLSKRRTDYRIFAVVNRNGSTIVIPQLPMSCWRVCYNISSTNSQLADCHRICRVFTGMF